MDSGEEKDTEVLVEPAEMAVAEAATEMEAAMIPVFFMSLELEISQICGLFLYFFFFFVCVKYKKIWNRRQMGEKCGKIEVFASIVDGLYTQWGEQKLNLC